MNDLLGQTGGYLLLTMLMMSLMSTGSGEVMAVSSIIVYDVYKTYIKPFRLSIINVSFFGWVLRRTITVRLYGDLPSLLVEEYFRSPLRALSHIRAGTSVEPPTFRKLAG